MLTKTTSPLFLAMILLAAVGVAQAQSLDNVEFKGVRHYPNEWTDTYEVKFSDVHPELATEIRTEITNYRMGQLQKARTAKARGDMNQVRRIEAETQREVRNYLAEKKAQYPPTRVVIYGAATKSDMRDALRFLKVGGAQFGKPMHVYVQNGQLTTSLAAPTKYDMPLAANGGTASSSSRSSSGQRFGGQASGGNGPSFDDLNRQATGGGAGVILDVDVPGHTSNTLFGF